jgi:hypothetical protein
MKHARDLSREQLVRIVDHVQQVLYLTANGQEMTWNPDKEWDCETIEYVAEAMIDAGLKPEEEMPRTPMLATDPTPVNPAVPIPRKADETRLPYKLNIDFTRLLEQKTALVDLIGDTGDHPLVGLVELLDAIQDQAVDVHEVPETDVFGPLIVE